MNLDGTFIIEKRKFGYKFKYVGTGTIKTRLYIYNEVTKEWEKIEESTYTEDQIRNSLEYDSAEEWAREHANKYIE